VVVGLSNKGNAMSHDKDKSKHQFAFIFV